MKAKEGKSVKGRKGLERKEEKSLKGRKGLERERGEECTHRKGKEIINRKIKIKEIGIIKRD